MTWTLHLGDCLEYLRTLPDGSVDAVVTSPPYAMQRESQYGGVEEADYPEWTKSWMNSIRRALSQKASVLINIREHVKDGQMSDYVHKTRMALREDGWFECDEIIWIKPESPPLGDPKRPRRSWERVLWFSQTNRPTCNATANGKKTDRIGFTISPSSKHFVSGFSDACSSGIARHPDFVSIGTGQNDSLVMHPAKFPTDFAKWLIRGWSDEGSTILDPFAGSGTTGIAALRMGRNFIGCELSPEYHAIATRRLKEAEQADGLFVGRK